MDELTRAEDVGPESILHSRAKTLSGTPNLLELECAGAFQRRADLGSWISFLPNGAHAFFSPISPVIGTEATAQCDLIEKRCKEYGFQCVEGRVLRLTAQVHHDLRHRLARAAQHRVPHLRPHRCRPAPTHDDDDQAAHSRRSCPRVVRISHRQCVHGRRRCDLRLQRRSAHVREPGWTNALRQRRKFHETLKDALDPAGILAPGKCGVWPKRYRGRGL